MVRRYEERFKKEAVKLVLEEGLSVIRVSEDLGVGRSTLQKWLKVAKSSGASSWESRLNESEKEELKRLRKECRTLHMERDILKKATAFFAKIS